MSDQEHATQDVNEPPRTDPAAGRLGERKRGTTCPFCRSEFDFEDIKTVGVLKPRIFACPLCDQRWREDSFLRDVMPPILRRVERVGPDVRLTTRSAKRGEEPRSPLPS